MIPFSSSMLGRGGVAAPPASVIQFVGGKTFGWKGTATGPTFDFTGLTGGIASSPAVGDYILIVAAESEAVPALAVVPVGVTSTPIAAIAPLNTTIDGWLYIWEGVYASGSASGGQFNTMSIGRSACVNILVFRNCKRGSGVAWHRSLGANPNPPPVVPVIANSWIVAMGNGASDLGSSQHTTPSDLTNVFKRAEDETYDTSLMTGQKTDWTSGTFDPAAFGGVSSNGSYSSNGATVVLVPATETVALPSYANSGGTGNRTGIIGISKVGTWTSSGSISGLIDGSQANNFWWSAGANNGSQGIQFDFGSAKVVDGFRWYQDNATEHGNFRFQGSPNGSSWTTIGVDFILGGANTSYYGNGNTVAYRYYRLMAISGSRSQAPYLREIEFSII